MTDTSNMLNLEELRQVVSSSSCINDVVHHFGFKTFSLRLRRIIKENQIDISHLSTSYKFIDKYPRKELEAIITSRHTWTDVMSELGYADTRCVDDVIQRCMNLGISTSHIPQIDSINRKFRKYTLQEICVEDSWYMSCNVLLNRLHKELGWKKQCSVCNLEEWNGKPIPLEIDHINGRHFDHRFENLRFICPNCHAQTNTYKGKNMNKRTTRNIKNKPQHVTPLVVVEKPPRQAKLPKPKNKCRDCGTDIKPSSIRCIPCYNRSSYTIQWPSYEELKAEIERSNFLQVGKKYGVSDNSVRKRLAAYEKQIAKNSC
jgi:hypothetical protein